MIKDIVPSVNNNKEAGLGQASAKKGQSTEAEARKGLFGKVLDSVQNALGQKGGQEGAGSADVKAEVEAEAKGEEQSTENQPVSDAKTMKKTDGGAENNSDQAARKINTEADSQTPGDENVQQGQDNVPAKQSQKTELIKGESDPEQEAGKQLKADSETDTLQAIKPEGTESETLNTVSAEPEAVTAQHTIDPNPDTIVPSDKKPETAGLTSTLNKEESPATITVQESKSGKESLMSDPAVNNADPRLQVGVVNVDSAAEVNISEHQKAATSTDKPDVTGADRSRSVQTERIPSVQPAESMAEGIPLESGTQLAGSEGNVKDQPVQSQLQAPSQSSNAEAVESVQIPNSKSEGSNRTVSDNSGPEVKANNQVSRNEASEFTSQKQNDVTGEQVSLKTSQNKDTKAGEVNAHTASNLTTEEGRARLSTEQNGSHAQSEAAVPAETNISAAAANGDNSGKPETTQAAGMDQPEIKPEGQPVAETTENVQPINGTAFSAGETEPVNNPVGMVAETERMAQPVDVQRREIFEKVLQPRMKELRTQFTAGSTTVPQAETERAELPLDTENVPGEMMKAKATEGLPEINIEAITAKKEEVRNRKYRLNHYSFLNQGLGENNSERLNPLSDSLNSTVSGFKAEGQPLFMQQQSNTSSTAPGLTQEQEMILKEQMMEPVEAKEQKGNEHFSLGMMRLGDIPVLNTTIRRNVLPGLTQTFSKAAESAKAGGETWQKHSFELDDGNNIQLTTRSVDGVIQVKLASSSSELAKLMQQYGQEIKTHLEQECDLKIDLQFENQQGQEMANFFGDASSSRNGNGSGSKQGAFRGNEQNAGRKAEQTIQQSVRKFGYNQMEWTV